MIITVQGNVLWPRRHSAPHPLGATVHWYIKWGHWTLWCLKIPTLRFPSSLSPLPLIGLQLTVLETSAWLQIRAGFYTRCRYVFIWCILGYMFPREASPIGYSNSCLSAWFPERFLKSIAQKSCLPARRAGLRREQCRDAHGHKAAGRHAGLRTGSTLCLLYDPRTHSNILYLMSLIKAMVRIADNFTQICGNGYKRWRELWRGVPSTSPRRRSSVFMAALWGQPLPLDCLVGGFLL